MKAPINKNIKLTRDLRKIMNEIILKRNSYSFSVNVNGKELTINRV